MEYFISNCLIKQLADTNAETRDLALKDISSILNNNILFKDSTGTTNELSVVNLHLLVRNLIGWFQRKPVVHESEVLDLLILLLSRRDFLRHIAKHITVARIKKEVLKINNLVVSGESYVKLHTINQLLDDYSSTILVDVANATGSFSHYGSSQVSLSNGSSSVVSHQHIYRTDSFSPSSFAKEEAVKSEVKEFWEKLDSVNLDTFNGLDAELSLFNEHVHLSNVINFLRTSIDDYPPEFFLQPPNILESIVDILHKVSNEHAIEIVNIVRFIIKGLKERCTESLRFEAQKKETSCVSVKRSINNILRTLTSYFEMILQNFNFGFFKDKLAVLNEIYTLLQDIATFIGETQNACEIYLNELMNMMGKFAKELRLTYKAAQEDANTIRLHYMISIYVINFLASAIDTNNISAFCINNVWEFESDIALLDGPLKMAHSGVYSLIMKNRKDVVKEDEELTLLLNVHKYWRPVVALFQSWEFMSMEEIIFKGVEAIDTIRIHRSLELVELLMTTIEKCEKKFSANRKLEEAAEEIYLRLLSIEVPEIRMLAYKIARYSVQVKLQGDTEDIKVDASLCEIIGIPLTTEIVTEILCFGFTDKNSELHKNVKLIIFALLRSKVVFCNHWLRILEVIRPILPLLPALFCVDKQMGNFTLDIYDHHSGFDAMEVNMGFARILFCNYPEAREKAKIKLLESFGIDNDIVEVVPDHFCIIPEMSVINLQLPESKIGFQEDAYETTCEVLKTINRGDEELMQSILLQLCVLMNSRNLCQKSHDDHIWVFFMSRLDMGFPHNAIIRKLTINILYKWVVTVPFFRIYLANEPSVLEFLIKTLVYYQEDVEVKKQTSWLLFLLLFSDFVVPGEKNISMPQFLSGLCCPFKFDHHWTDSPFNKNTKLELFYELLDANNEAVEIREVSQNYLKFSFAFEWFKREANIVEIENFNSDAYYQNRSVNSMKVCKKLQLSASDVLCLRQTVSEEILKDLCARLDKTMSVSVAKNLILQTKNLLTLPVANKELVAETIDRRIERLMVYDTRNPEQQSMFIGFMQVYRLILEWLKDDRVVNILLQNFFTCVLLKEPQLADDETFIEGFNLITPIVKLCHARPRLMNLLIKTFERQHKIHWPSRLVEKLSDHLFEGVMQDQKWHEAGKRPIVKSILFVLHTVMRFLPIQLDDAYLKTLFHKFLQVTKRLYRSHHNHVKASSPLHIHSNLLKHIFGIMLCITTTAARVEMQPDQYKNLMFWALEKTRKHKSIPWLIVAQLSKTKENFELICKVHEEIVSASLQDTTYMMMLESCNRTDQKAIVGVIGNILDYSPPTTAIDAKYLNMIVDKLLDSENISALCAVVRKMVQNDIPQTTALVTQKHLIRHFLNFDIRDAGCAEDYNSIAYRLETVIICFKHKPLKKHVSETVIYEATADFMRMLIDTSARDEIAFKRFNHAAFEMVLIMMQAEVGLVKICQAVNEASVVNCMMIASHDGMRTTNTYNEIMFQLGFWKSLIEACERFDSPVVDLISTHRFDPTTMNLIESSPTYGDDKSKARKFGTILEKEFARVSFGVDLLFLQVASIFDFVYSSKFSAEYKHDLKVLCFLVISKLTARNERVRQLAGEINLTEVITEKLELSLAVMQSHRYLETTKKNGVQKSQYIIKDLCIFLKAFIEWRLPLKTIPRVIKEIYVKLLKVSDWIDADSVLMNCFLNFSIVISKLEIGKSCIMEKISGKPIVNVILSKAQALSVKPPHTELNLALVRNGISALKSFSNFVEVRMILKNAKIFQLLEYFHPHIHKTRKSTWDEVTAEWLKFFEFLSRFEDVECTTSHISLLCRFFRLGNPFIGKTSLIVIRNFSLRASIGHVLLNSVDFTQTVDDILIDSSDTQEKLIILETLLSIASKGDQLKAKLKNSSLNRKLKDQLQLMQADSKYQSNPENIKILNLTAMLAQVLYSKD